MNKISSLTPYRGVLFSVLMAAAVGCTTTDPYTGQQRVDYGATAGAAGLALGAAALGVAISNSDDDDDRRDVTIIDRRPVYRPAYRPYRPYRSARPSRPY